MYKRQEDDIDNDIALLQQVQNVLLMTQQERNKNDNVIRQKVKDTLHQARQQLELPQHNVSVTTLLLCQVHSVTAAVQVQSWTDVTVSQVIFHLVVRLMQARSQP